MKSLKEQVIAHWQRMHDDAPGVYKSQGECPNNLNCAYCLTYKMHGCRGCPIMVASGKIVCYGTPYRNALDAWIFYKESDWNMAFKAAWQAAAVKMIEFLKGLPDEGEEPKA